MRFEAVKAKAKWRMALVADDRDDEPEFVCRDHDHATKAQAEACPDLPSRRSWQGLGFAVWWRLVGRRTSLDAGNGKRLAHEAWRAATKERADG